MARRLPEFSRVGPRRSRTFLIATVAISVLLHLLLLYYLGGVPLGIGSPGERADDASLELAPDAQARAETSPERREVPRPRPQISRVTLPTVQFRRPER